jgi:hypothetical protein
MTDRLARDAQRLFATFLAELMEAAQRRAIEAVECAFREAAASVTAASASHARPPPTAASFLGGDRARVDARRVYGPRLSPNNPIMRERVIALLRERPGLGTKHLAEQLQCKVDQLRRFLDAMVRDRQVRFEDLIANGLRRRAYYVVHDRHGEAPVDGDELMRRADVPTEAQVGAMA